MLDPWDLVRPLTFVNLLACTTSHFWLGLLPLVRILTISVLFPNTQHFYLTPNVFFFFNLRTCSTTAYKTSLPFFMVIWRKLRAYLLYSFVCACVLWSWTWNWSFGIVKHYFTSLYVFTLYIPSWEDTIFRMTWYSARSVWFVYKVRPI